MPSKHPRVDIDGRGNVRPICRKSKNTNDGVAPLSWPPDHCAEEVFRWQKAVPLTRRSTVARTGRSLDWRRTVVSPDTGTSPPVGATHASPLQRRSGPGLNYLSAAQTSGTLRRAGRRRGSIWPANWRATVASTPFPPPRAPRCAAQLVHVPFVGAGWPGCRECGRLQESRTIRVLDPWQASSTGYSSIARAPGGRRGRTILRNCSHQPWRNANISEPQ